MINEHGATSEIRDGSSVVSMDASNIFKKNKSEYLLKEDFVFPDTFVRKSYSEGEFHLRKTFKEGLHQTIELTSNDSKEEARLVLGLIEVQEIRELTERVVLLRTQFGNIKLYNALQFLQTLSGVNIDDFYSAQTETGAQVSHELIKEGLSLIFARLPKGVLDVLGILAVVETDALEPKAVGGESVSEAGARHNQGHDNGQVLASHTYLENSQFMSLSLKNDNIALHCYAQADISLWSKLVSASEWNALKTHSHKEINLKYRIPCSVGRFVLRRDELVDLKPGEIVFFDETYIDTRSGICVEVGDKVVGLAPKKNKIDEFEIVAKKSVVAD